MAWTLRFSETALKQLSKLDKPVSDKITRILSRQVAENPNPRSHGRALTGELKGFWRYRIGDYRVICNLQTNELVVLALTVGHRKEVYK